MQWLTPTTQAKVDVYEAVIDVFNELFKELKDLGKKKPDMTLNKAKIKIINRILEDVQICLKDEPNYKYLDLLDEDELPQYSDAILILAQHDGALSAFKSHHYGWTGDEHRWIT